MDSPHKCPYKQGLGSEVQCVLSKGHTGKHLWHPEADETSAARLLGRKGGLSRSEAKVKAARQNAKKAGRPKGSKNKPSEYDLADIESMHRNDGMK